MATIEEALNQGWKTHQAGDLRSAENIYRQVLLLDNANANAWCFLGMACHDQARYDDAVAAYRQAIQFRPNFPVALSNLGNTYKAMGRFDEAIASCRESLRLKPDYHTAHNNLGVVLVSLGRLDEAAQCFEAAIRFAPGDAVAHTNLSAALVRQGKYTEAKENSQRALNLNPAYAEAHKNQGIVWLLQGEFERGWDEYEWRWRCPGCAMPNFPKPLWDGSPLNGSSILLHVEQGLGDTLHFVRYATLLKRMGARVILQCQKALLPILQSFPDVDCLIDQATTPPPFDVHAPLMSLPRLFKTRLETIPAAIPYLKATPANVALWQRELAGTRDFKVGIAWQGSASNHADRQRSTALRQFEPIGRIPGVRLYSLQKGAGAEQVAAERGRMIVYEFGERLDAQGAFVDTAAIMANLDLVITVDTAIAHVAGALGVPVWIALNFSPDWRWLLQRSDSPWYPSARLFRQPRLGDWEPVFQAMAAELNHLVASRTFAAPDHVGVAGGSADNVRHVASVSINVAPADLIDKMTILEIKHARVSDGAKLVHIRLELEHLRDVFASSIPVSVELNEQIAQLKAINETLWNVEEEIRECERRQDFGPRFVELARSVYHHDDQRSTIKRQINDLLQAQIIEEKSYAN